MMNNKKKSYKKGMLLAGVLAGSILVSPANPQSANPAQVQAPTAPVAATRVSMTSGHRQPSRFSRRAELYYSLVWGVDSLSVKWVESGEIIRFAYHVVDADKAKPLNDKKVEPSLVDPTVGVSLVIPSLEKVGQLRQKSTPETGRSYWMAFSNRGRRVKKGDHVNVVIGDFHANGLVVD